MHFYKGLLVIFFLIKATKKNIANIKKLRSDMSKIYYVRLRVRKKNTEYIRKREKSTIFENKLQTNGIHKIEI